MQSISWEMPDWIKHKLESRLPGEISITSEMQMIPHLWQKVKKNWRVTWWGWKRRLKTQHFQLSFPNFLRNRYAYQEATVRTGHGTTDYFQIGKGVSKGCILSSCLFNLHAEYIIINARLDETQVGIKIAQRNINNLRYADDTIFTAESKESLINSCEKKRSKKQRRKGKI